MRGLYHKYFVLKPEGTDEHAIASRVAMLAYAEDIEKMDSKLSTDIRAWVARESRRAYLIIEEPDE